MTPAKFKLVRIEWLDSRGVTTGWDFYDDLTPLKPMRCFTVGYLIEETAEYKTLVQTISDDQCVGRITIPRRAIVKQKALK